jgi:Site-specific recombinases, DNA invertase Pin homologs
MSTIGIYTRVSTDEQRDKGHSIAAQIAKAEKLIENNIDDFGNNKYKLYNDAGYSAKNLKRPAMTQVLIDITEQRLKFLLFYSLDRISRDLNDLMYFLHHSEVNDCRLICITQDVSYTTPDQRMFVLMQGVFAQFEREKISERTKNGLAGGFEKGNYTIPKVPFGYKRIDKKLVIHTNEAKIVKKIFQLYTKDKWSLNRIYEHLKYSSDTSVRAINYNTVCKVIQNQIYCGHIMYQNKLYKNIAKPIITEKTFASAKTIQNTGKHSRHIKKKYDYLFKGKTHCSACCRTLTGQSTLKKTRVYLYYICNNKTCPCYKKRISEEIIISALETELMSLTKQFYQQSRLQILKKNGISDAINKHESEIKSLNVKINKLNLAYIDEVINKLELRELKKQYEAEIKYHITEINLLTDSVVTTSDFKSLTKNQQQTFIKNNLEAKKVDLINKIIL